MARDGRKLWLYGREPEVAKGFDVVKSTMKDHVRLIGPDDKSVKNDRGGAAFSFSEARRYQKGLPGQRCAAAGANNAFRMKGR